MPDDGQFAVLPRLGIAPTVHQVVREALTAAVARAEAASPGPWPRSTPGAAGPHRCAGSDGGSRAWSGRTSTPPTCRSPYLDEFAVVDLCGPRDAFAPGTFDIVLSSFTARAFR